MTEQTTTIEAPVSQRENDGSPNHQERKFDALLSRIDLVAIVITIVGACLLAIAAAVLAAIEAARLISNLCSNPLDRWLTIIFCTAIVWVTVRWKRSRLS